MRTDHRTHPHPRSVPQARRLGPRRRTGSRTPRPSGHRRRTGVLPEVVYHLAARIDVRTSVTDPARDAAVSVGGTINLLNAAREVGARPVFTFTDGAGTTPPEDAPWRRTPGSPAQRFK
ncbi:GDP-mannose 4,6-dehydratase [Spongiactinospora rosea]|uniref:GDP-mannose 4,6-dehydratase n=1 Tax=Spongiactinospora rosea TaxID=2248750 RepID=UPI00298E2B9F|nr:GDP-mannose 4,6-dehydratase [Spongiactinospora rosea]